jgi:lipoprotein-releasing system ATP-binding protein
MADLVDQPPVLKCVNLGKVFRQGSQSVDVLRGVDFEIKPGERAAIFGSSGAGKSTLLQLLGGLDVPTTGGVEVGGHDLARMGDAARGRLRNRMLGFVYQFHHLLQEFTALENVAMPLLIRGQPVAVASRRAADLLGKVGLGSRLTHKPAELSGGERQRAAVARALITEPACILADEPTGNLDRRNAGQVFELMLDLNRSLGTSFVIVTHDHSVADQMDRIWYLVDGVLECES